MTKNLKKREAILAITQVVNMPKYKVLGHETTGAYDVGDIPNGTKTVAVIYLG